MMKKWLNIKPKVYDFSADEVDTETETESEEEGMISPSNINIRFLVYSVLNHVFLQLSLLKMQEHACVGNMALGHRGIHPLSKVKFQAILLSVFANWISASVDSLYKSDLPTSNNHF